MMRSGISRRPAGRPRDGRCCGCGGDVDTLHHDGTALFCAACCRAIAAAMPASSDLRPIQLIRPRPRLETK